LEVEGLVEEISSVVRRENPDFARLEGDLHVTLSRTAYLRGFQIDAFVRQVSEALEGQGRFQVHFTTPETYVNDEGTRHFMGLATMSQSNRLNTLKDLMDTVFSRNGFLRYYADAKFHVSVGWQLGEFSPATLPALHSLASRIHVQSFPVDVVHLKIGNRIHKIPLR